MTNSVDRYDLTVIFRNFTGVEELDVSVRDIYLVNLEYKGYELEICVLKNAIKEDLGPGWRIHKNREYRTPASIKEDILTWVEKVDEDVKKYEQFVQWLIDLKDV